MSERTLNETIEDIAGQVMMADPADGASMARLDTEFEQLEQLLTGAAEDVTDGITECRFRLAAIISGQSKNPSKDMEFISGLATRLQEGESGKDADYAKSDGSSGVLVLPDLVDESLLKEFLSGQELVLEEIEQDILDLEKGVDTAAAALKGKIHTMKGEAGVLGLADLERACHDLEDRLVDAAPSPALVDLLLKAKDWISEAVRAYTEMRVPPPAPEFETLDSEPQEKAVEEEKAETESETAKPKAKKKKKPSNDKKSSKVKKADTQPAAKGASTAGPVPAKRDAETIALTGEFLQEAYEGVGQADEILLAAESDTADAEMVNGLFRVFHTIKGVAGFLELTEITSLAHDAETMLDKVRDGDLFLRGGVLDLTFDATHMMNEMLDRLKVGLETGFTAEPVDGLDALLERLRATTRGEPVAEEPVPDVDLDAKLGQVLTQTADIPQEKIVEALRKQDETGRRLGEELIAERVAEPKKVAQALRAQNRAQDLATGRIQEKIKIDVDRVDSLVEVIGELVIVESMVVHSPEIVAMPSPEVRKHLKQLGNITRDLQDIGMRMRMVPLRGVFQKMSRMVRDLSRKSSKRIRLTVSGEDAEMDRGMVERIADPLVHMIRNAVDHGIETPEEREKAGKPIEGHFRLSAYHQGGAIVIEVADDGRGLDREAILKKAMDKGIVKEGAKLSDTEINNLIFAPGFSTAQQVTEISGRGVGMDVVKRNIDAMRGRVSISSEPGVGTTFQISLPLTLAIIDGTLVRCGQERYIIPTLSIAESVHPTESMLHTMAGNAELMNMRGEILPMMRLSRIFKISEAETDPTRALVVVLETEHRRIGLLVDEVVSQQQVVIKSLGSGLADIKHVAGASILSDGRVGLILNVDEIGNLLDEDAFRQARETVIAADEAESKEQEDVLTLASM